MPSAAHARALIGGAGLATAAVLARRPDLLVLATPLIVAAVWALMRRPSRPLAVTQSIAHPTVREGEATTWLVTVDRGDERVDDVAVVLEDPTWIQCGPINGMRAMSRADDADDRLAVTLQTLRWGFHRVQPALVVASSSWAGFRWVESRKPADARTLACLPYPSLFTAASSPLRTPGLVGAHRSPAAGSGSEFESIRPFQPGDRLRRIHWAHSQRTGALHVTSTSADQDRHVELLIDAIEDIGVSGGLDGRASSLDIAVRAAGAVAAHYVARGDRVALSVVGSRASRRIPASTGPRHLRRLLDAMARIDPAPEFHDDGRLPPGLRRGALVIAMTPLLSRGAVNRVVAIAGHGLDVVVVDCLPDDIALHDADDPVAELAWTYETIKRESTTLRRLRERGIPVVSWRGPGSIDAVVRLPFRGSTVRSGGHR